MSESEQDKDGKRTFSESGPIEDDQKVDTESKEGLEAVKATAKKLLPRTISREEATMILHITAQLKLEGKEVAAPGNLAKRVAAYTGRGHNQCRAIWKHFASGRGVLLADAAGPRGARPARFVASLGQQQQLREWLASRRRQGIMTSSRHVLHLFVARGWYPCDLDNARAVQSGVRFVSRQLHMLGYRSGQMGAGLGLSPQTELERDLFVAATTRARGHRRTVYVIEGVVGHKHARVEEDCLHPGEPRDEMLTLTGGRWRFAVAMLGADTASAEEEIGQNAASSPQVLLDTLHLVADVSKRGAASKEAGDGDGPASCPAPFPAADFEAWFAHVVGILHHRGIADADIVMSGRASHRQLPADTPTRSWSKEALLGRCHALGMSVSPNLYKAEIWDIVSKVVRADVQPTVVKLASESGHRVLFLPPQYADLNPLEYVTAMAKSAVASQFHDDVSMDCVRERIVRAFAELSAESLGTCLEHTWSLISALERDMAEDDARGDVTVPEQQESGHAAPPSEPGSPSDLAL